jgi:hypothetical protein
VIPKESPNLRVRGFLMRVKLTKRRKGDDLMTSVNVIKNLYPIEEGKISFIQLDVYGEPRRNPAALYRSVVPYIQAGYTHVINGRHVILVASEPANLTHLDIDSMLSEPPASVVDLSMGRKGIIYYADIDGEDLNQEEENEDMNTEMGYKKVLVKDEELLNEQILDEHDSEMLEEIVRTGLDKLEGELTANPDQDIDELIANVKERCEEQLPVSIAGKVEIVMGPMNGTRKIFGGWRKKVVPSFIPNAKTVKAAKGTTLSQRALTLHQFQQIMKTIEEKYRFGRFGHAIGIKYVDPVFDMRTMDCFSIKFRYSGGETVFDSREIDIPMMDAINRWMKEEEESFKKAVEAINTDREGL